MLDDLRMDSHKLIFHPQRLSAWLEGQYIYPLTVEISPSGACNHRCIFCGLDYLGYQPRWLDKELIMAGLEQMQTQGVKAIVMAGEGEPLLNPAAPVIINHARQIGLDVGMSSNGVLLTRAVAQECLASLSWIRFSVNASNEDMYKKVHRGRDGDFSRVLHNLAEAVAIKQRQQLPVTIGVQLVLLPENHENLLEFATQLKNMGVDYFSIKPFSQHPQSHSRVDEDFNYTSYLNLEEELVKLNSPGFEVIFRAASMRKLDKCRSYERCLGIPFWAYIDSNATVWPCLAYLGQPEFALGNLKEQSFADIWTGERGRGILKKMSRMDISNCRELCRLDAINEYLHQLVHPGAHVNFV